MTWSFYCPISRSEARFEVRERKREVDNEGFPALNVIFLPSCVFLLFFSFRKLLLARLPVFFEPFSLGANCSLRSLNELPTLPTYLCFFPTLSYTARLSRGKVGLETGETDAFLFRIGEWWHIERKWPAIFSPLSMGKTRTVCHSFKIVSCQGFTNLRSQDGFILFVACYKIKRKSISCLRNDAHPNSFSGSLQI